MFETRVWPDAIDDFGTVPVINCNDSTYKLCGLSQIILYGWFLMEPNVTQLEVLSLVKPQHNKIWRASLC